MAKFIVQGKYFDMESSNSGRIFKRHLFKHPNTTVINCHVHDIKTYLPYNET